METGKPLFLTNEGREPAAKGPMKALVAGGLHYIRSGDGSEELYNLETDRKEQTNLAGLPSAGVTLQSFRAALVGMLGKRRPAEVAPTARPQALLALRTTSGASRTTKAPNKAISKTHRNFI